MTGGGAGTVMPCDWSSLPDELLQLIMKRLWVQDYIRFGAVCRNWRGVFLMMRHHHPVPPEWLPWVWIRSRGALGLGLFYSPSEQRFYDLKLPDYLADCPCIGGSYKGWLMFLLPADEQPSHLDGQPGMLLDKPLLVNPLSGAQIQLPDLVRLGWLNSYIEKFYLSHNPDDPQCVAAWVRPWGELAVCALKSATWRSISPTKLQNFFSSAIFYKGFLFAVTRAGELHFLQLTTPLTDPLEPHLVIVPPEEGLRSMTLPLIEHGGELLMIELLQGSHRFRTFKANLEVGRWQLMDNVASLPILVADYWAEFLPFLRDDIFLFLKNDDRMDMVAREKLINEKIAAGPDYQPIILSPNPY